MPASSLEHVNITASDPKKTAKMLHDIFGWHTRWEGESLAGGYSIHVGSEDTYIAIYSPRKAVEAKSTSYMTKGGLNHVGVVVEDIDETEAKVKAQGFEPVNHADYEPGKRFYFHDHDDIEWEVVSYA